MKIVNSNYINGEFKKVSTDKSITLLNPTTQDEIAQIFLGDEKDTNEAINAANEAHLHLCKTTISQRGEILQRIYNELIKKEDELNKVATLEYGATITTTKRRTRNAINLFLHIKKEMESFDFVKSDEFSMTLKEGVGVIGVILPWNAAYAHLCANIAPAIAMGCTLVIKPSEYNALEVELFLECLHKADIPKGVINIVQGSGECVGEFLTKHKKVNAISFTGSSQTGKKIYENCAKTIKRITLELGGKSPTIFLEDADLNSAIPKAVSAAFSNSGQACHAGSRLIVSKSKLEVVKELLYKEINKLKIGDPTLQDTQIGPMINKKQYDIVQSYIKSGIDEGATLILGGLGKPENIDIGYFVKPTVFLCHNTNLKIAREEIFGPVICVFTYDDEKQALKMANDTDFGLSAYVFSNNKQRAIDFAKEIKSGRVLINTDTSKAPYPPFGGMKESGLGRLGGRYSMDEFCEIKSILF